MVNERGVASLTNEVSTITLDDEYVRLDVRAGPPANTIALSDHGFRYLLAYVEPPMSCHEDRQTLQDGDRDRARQLRAVCRDVVSDRR